METISIPYPVWTALGQIKEMIEVFKKVSPYKGAPTFENPRRISFSENNLRMKIKLWNTAGQYATVIIQGVEDDTYGTDWYLESVRVRWTYQTDENLKYPQKADIKLDGEIFKALHRVIDEKAQLRYVKSVNPGKIPKYEVRVEKALKNAKKICSNN